MAKDCLFVGCPNHQFGGGYCKWHQWCRKDIQQRINPLSVNQAADLEIYETLSRDYLADNPICQCGWDDCERPAIEVHHKRGRGKWLNVVEYFLAVARYCHDRIHANPKEAKKRGLLISK